MREASTVEKVNILSYHLEVEVPTGLTINLSVDNEFEIYSDPPNALGAPFGSGNLWSTTYSFTTETEKYLTIRAENCGTFNSNSNPMGILLSTSEGLVSDINWRCIGEKYADRTPFEDWPQALMVGTHGIAPWNNRPNITSTAQWIWANPPGGEILDRVICYRRLGDN